MLLFKIGPKIQTNQYFENNCHLICPQPALINPDAFAASTTVDPFLAASMYLDQQCIERHEAEFKRWLNALVTIPDDLPEQPQTVDFGQLFHSVRHRDIGVAQTKEVVSANHFTRYRLDGLRRTAIALYTSDELSVPLAKLVVQIERKLIAIRDRDLHVDVVLQRQLLELLLGFNPLWLRLGLEITFGEQIAMRHSGDLMALSAFMVRRLFRDRHLDERTTALQKRQPEYAEGQRKFALKKMLTLFVFIDTAKRKRLVKHNPCLFVLGAELKDMRSVLMRFASSHIANLGDIQKDLRRIGIVLSHKQTYLDEFDYAFRNLAVDLRDGVRLSRLMEILLLRDDLMDRLRVPAISRLQRVHNVEVALGAWREADFVISGECGCTWWVDHMFITISFRIPKQAASPVPTSPTATARRRSHCSGSSSTSSAHPNSTRPPARCSAGGAPPSCASASPGASATNACNARPPPPPCCSPRSAGCEIAAGAARTRSVVTPQPSQCRRTRAAGWCCVGCTARTRAPCTCSAGIGRPCRCAPNASNSTGCAGPCAPCSWSGDAAGWPLSWSRRRSQLRAPERRSAGAMRPQFCCSDASASGNGRKPIVPGSCATAMRPCVSSDGGVPRAPCEANANDSGGCALRS